MNCRTEIICLLLAVVWAAVSLSAAPLAELPVGSVIACEGSYGDHIQGMATDGEAIYWSFASTLVKTDLNGNVLKSVPGPIPLRRSVLDGRGALCPVRRRLVEPGDRGCGVTQFHPRLQCGA